MGGRRDEADERGRCASAGPVITKGMNPMGIVFFCQSCGARFEVDPRMAGKKGRCKKCGQYMTIPRAEEIASMAAMPALAVAGVGAGVAAASGGRRRVDRLLAQGGDQPGGPGADHARPDAGSATKKPAIALDDAEDSKPYVLAQPDARRIAAG